MDRRIFLQTLAGSMVTSMAMVSCRSHQPMPVKRDKILLGMKDIRHNTFIRVLDTGALTFVDVPVPVNVPHSILRSTQNYDEYFVIEFVGSAVKIDAKSGKVTKLSSNNEQAFQGHALQSSDGKVLWCTEFIRDKGSFVRARSPESMELLKDIPSFEGGHHLTALPGTSILVSGGQLLKDKSAYINFFDASSGKVIRNVALKESLIHLHSLSSKEIVAVTHKIGKTKNGNQFVSRVKDENGMFAFTEDVDLNSPGPMTYVNLDGEVSSYWGNQNEQKFVMSFGIDKVPGDNELYLTGHINSNTVILWNKFEVVHVFDIPSPMNIVVSDDGERFFVLSNGAIFVYSLRSFKKEATIKYPNYAMVLSGY